MSLDTNNFCPNCQTNSKNEDRKGAETAATPRLYTCAAWRPLVGSTDPVWSPTYSVQPTHGYRRTEAPASTWVVAINN